MAGIVVICFPYPFKIDGRFQAPCFFCRVSQKRIFRWVSQRYPLESTIAASVTQAGLLVWPAAFNSTLILRPPGCPLLCWVTSSLHAVLQMPPGWLALLRAILFLRKWAPFPAVGGVRLFSWGVRQVRWQNLGPLIPGIYVKVTLGKDRMWRYFDNFSPEKFPQDPLYLNVLYLQK